VVLFVQTILYSVGRVGSSDCWRFNNPKDCYAELSPFKTGNPICGWVPDNSGGYCYDLPPLTDVAGLIVLQFVAYLIAYPMCFAIDEVLLFVISAPTLAPDAAHASNHDQKSRGNNVSSIYQQHEPTRGKGLFGIIDFLRDAPSMLFQMIGNVKIPRIWQMTNEDIHIFFYYVMKPKLIRHYRKVRHYFAYHSNTMDDMQYLTTRAQDDLKDLLVALNTHRKLLTPDMRTKFDGRFIIL
jgi:hypothetical protein